MVRAPLGLIQFGSNLDRAPGTVRLLPGSLTSVSGAELVMPYGGTTDGINYLVNQVPIQLTGAGGALAAGTLVAGVGLYASEVDVQQGRGWTCPAAANSRGWIHLRQRGSTDARFHPWCSRTMMGSVCRSCPATRCMPSCLDTRPLVRHWAARRAPSSRWSGNRSPSGMAFPAWPPVPTPCCLRPMPCCRALSASRSTVWRGKARPWRRRGCAMAPGRRPGSCRLPARPSATV